MKKLMISTVLAIIVVSCSLSLYDLITTSWTISGTVSFTATTPGNVKLSAYYTNGDTYLDSMQYPEAFDPVKVSNVADLGTSGGSFSLTIDASALGPEGGDSIYLIMWINADGNSDHDLPEQWSFVEAYYDCPVFQDSWFCEYYFEEDSNPLMGTEYGWNQSIGIASFVPIDNATKQGAKIQEYFWF